ncbi:MULTISPECIES: M10 family metallopeptidase C-terminal domain-containing protein [Pseudomonas fluorescens group]|nr:MULTISPECIES: M10 family metallopeptidase C-terminal domain-containing protein [Pseudomonas fluorescens group]
MNLPTHAPQTIALPDSNTRPIAPLVNGKQSLSTEQAANLLIQRGLSDLNRDGTINILYEFFSPAKSENHTFHSPSAFNENQKDHTRRALQSWEDLANIRFTERPEPTALVEVQPVTEKYTRYDKRIVFANNDFNANTWNDEGWNAVGAVLDNTTEAPDYGHEHFKRGLLTRAIGNAIGLGTPLQIPTRSHIDATAKTLPGDTAFHTKDNLDYTIMSSHAGKNSHIGYESRTSSITESTYLKAREEVRPAAAMMHDIAAVQKIYGANLETRNTDTVYGFNSNTDRDLLSLNSAKDKPLFCVWDGGGNDTLDFSGFSQNQKINLYERSFSDVGGMKGNVSIARGVTLENAIGGTGDDLLIGNHVDNRLKGGAGADTLEGGNGADTFIYDHASDSAPDNPDLITDFSSGTDKIDLSGVLKSSGASNPAFVEGFTSKAGEIVLNYDAKSGRGSLAIDLTGNGQADLLIKTVGQIHPGDVLVSSQLQPPVAAISSQEPPLIHPAPAGLSKAFQPRQIRQNMMSPLSQAPTDDSVVKPDNVAYRLLPNIEFGPTASGSSRVPDTDSPITILSVRNGNWNRYIDMPEHPKDNDLVVINMTASDATKVIYDSLEGTQYLEIKPGEKRALRYSEYTDTWRLEPAGDETQWVGSKILLGSSHPLISLSSEGGQVFENGAWQNVPSQWRPEAILPSEAIDGDVLTVHSDLRFPIDIKTSDINDPTVWQLTKGDSIDFIYSAKTETWEMRRPTQQFYRAQALVNGVLPTPVYKRTYIEADEKNWRSSITLPTKGLREGQQVVVKSTADKNIKINTNQVSYTIGAGETATFRADKNGQWTREQPPYSYLGHLYMRQGLNHFARTGEWT